MAELIYGVDISKPMTPLMVRKALVLCFKQAHCAILDGMKEYGKDCSEEEFEKIKDMDVNLLIKRFFEEVHDDFNNPSKKGLIKVMNKLKEYAQNFRSSEIVMEHYDSMMRLVNML